MLTVKRVRIISASGQSLASRINRLERDLTKAAIVWCGTQAEYEKWVDRSVEQGLQGITRHAGADVETL